MPQHKAEIQKKTRQRIIDKFAGIKAISQSMNSEDDGINMKRELQNAEELLASVGANDALSTMLVTQMAAVHDMQQRVFSIAKTSYSPEVIQSNINQLTKLSNVFVQQAALLEKMQGNVQQKVMVEHVHIHSGGQAIVGNVERGVKK